MAAFFIGEVERLTGIKSYILRYWEQNVPLISSQKDGSGRRVYSVRDVQIIFRLKYLIQNKRFTLEGAREQLINDFSNENNSKTEFALAQLRAELIGLYSKVRETIDLLNEIKF